MSGHSKWSTIKRAKGVADIKRGVTFTKLVNAITIAARLGGSGEVDSNPRLRMIIEEARGVNMPKENIQRAIDRGLGKILGQVLEEITYEGFGPFKVAFYIEAVTDNKNRTNAEVRNIFDRAGGGLGGQGSTSYMFEKLGQIVLESKEGKSEDEMLELIDLGAEDVEEVQDDKTHYIISTQFSDLNLMSNKFTGQGYKVVESEIILKPNITVELTNPLDISKIEELTAKLEDLDDIQKVYHNGIFYQ